MSSYHGLSGRGNGAGYGGGGRGKGGGRGYGGGGKGAGRGYGGGGKGAGRGYGGGGKGAGRGYGGSGGGSGGRSNAHAYPKRGNEMVVRGGCRSRSPKRQCTESGPSETAEHIYGRTGSVVWLKLPFAPINIAGLIIGKGGENLKKLTKSLFPLVRFIYYHSINCRCHEREDNRGQPPCTRSNEFEFWGDGADFTDAIRAVYDLCAGAIASRLTGNFAGRPVSYEEGQWYKHYTATRQDPGWITGEFLQSWSDTPEASLAAADMSGAAASSSS